MADYSSLYQSAGSTFNVDPLLAQAVAQVESGENPGLTSPQGAVGVMQVMPGNLQRLNVPNPYNPEFNIPAGTRMLDEALTTANGNVPLALRIYQGGPDQSKWGPQNAAYPGKVAQAYQKLVATQRSAPAQPNDAVDDLIAGKSSPSGNDALDDFIMGKSSPAGSAQVPGKPAAAPDPLDEVISGGNAPAWAQSKPPPPPQVEAGIDPITGFPIDTNGAPMSGAGSTLAGKDQGTVVPSDGSPAAAPKKPAPQIDPITGQPFQYAGNVPANDPVGQSTGKPIAENQIPGVGVQAAIGLGTDAEQKRRIAAAQLFSDKSPAEALSRVFYGSDGRLAAVGENGQPFYVDPAPVNAPGIFDPGPQSLAQSVPTDNPLARVASGVGEVPAMAGSIVGGAVSGGNPLAVGAGASVGDLVRQEVARYLDPQPQAIDLGQAAMTGLQYGVGEGAGRAGAAFLPKNALMAVPHPASGPFSLAARDAEAAPLPADFMSNPLASRASAAPFTPVPKVEIQAGDNALQVPAKSGQAAPSSPNPNVAPAAAPAPTGPITSAQVQQRDGVGYQEALRRANAENAAAAQANATSAPAPQSAGAAASRDMSNPSVIDMTPAQVQAYRSTAEGQKLLEPQQPGVQDTNAYVPGVTPSEAEIEQTVNAARELKSLNVTAPEVSQEAKETAAENSAKRQQFFSDTAGSPVTVQNLREARSAQFTKDSEATLASGTGDADTAPVTNTINDILNSPTGRQNTELQTYVRPLLNRLQDADGVARITDPAELIGFRQDVNRMLSKTSQAATPNLAHISDELRSIVGATDDAIEAARPGYAQQRANYANYSRQIDEQNVLQGFEPRLYGANNQMQYSRVQNMMRQIVDARSSPGVNEAKSIADETMQRLWNLRDDLRRVASAQDLARAPGSDSVQNAFDALVGHGKKAADVLVHGAIATHLPGVGNLAYTAVKNSISAGAEKRAAARQTARGLEMLHPKTPLRNPLQPP
jgi:hypothetical protein